MKMQSNKQDIQLLSVSNPLPTQVTGNAISDSFPTQNTLKAAPKQTELDPELESREHSFRAFIASRLSRHKAPQSLLQKIRRNME